MILRIFVLTKKSVIVYAVALFLLIGIFVAGNNFGQAIFTEAGVPSTLPIYSVETPEKKIAISEANCVMSKKIIKLHRNYIAGILGFAIIMLITAKYGGPNNAIFEYLSFGSTVTSLVLSILAIFVTFEVFQLDKSILKDGASCPVQWNI